MLLLPDAAEASREARIRLPWIVLSRLFQPIYFFFSALEGDLSHIEVEQHGGIPEQRQELFGEVLTPLNSSSQLFLCFRLIPNAAQGVHTHQLVLMRCTEGCQGGFQRNNPCISQSPGLYVLIQLNPLQEKLSQSAL